MHFDNLVSKRRTKPCPHGGYKRDINQMTFSESKITDCDEHQREKIGPCDPGKPPSGSGLQLGHEKQVMVQNLLGKVERNSRCFCSRLPFLLLPYPDKQMATYKFYLLNAPPVCPLLLVLSPFHSNNSGVTLWPLLPVFPSSPFLVLRCKSDVSTPHFSTFLKALYRSSLPQDGI